MSPNEPDRKGPGWPLAKSAALIPELFRVALAYGRNPLTGTPSPAGMWRIRNTIRWVRPNPPVGALGDKFRPATSDMVVACRAKNRWFDLDAVRHTNERTDELPSRGGPTGYEVPRSPQNATGAPPLDWWKISPGGYPGAHYATYPAELCRIPVLAMCPPEVCRTCGTPRRRLVDIASHGEWRREDLNGTGSNHGGPGTHGDRTRQAETIGWSDCPCDTPDYQPGVVLDPFAGTGTTLLAATGHGRHAIGIDLDASNLTLAHQRVGIFLTDGPTPPAWLHRG